MSNQNQVTVLGSGTSTGIPVIGCNCEICNSTDIKDKRLRSSILINYNGKLILVDTSPDLRTQLLSNNIKNIDACIITHTHADHTHGIDDLRTFGFFNSAPIQMYTSEQYCQELTEKYPYIFNSESHFGEKPILGGGIPKIQLNQLTEFSPTDIAGIEFIFFEMPHGYVKTLGFMVGKMAYLIDCKAIPDRAIDLMKARNLEILIIDCVRIKPHKTHLHLDLAIEYIAKIGAKESYLTHLSHDFSHKKLVAELSERKLKGISPAYDNLCLSFS